MSDSDCDGFSSPACGLHEAGDTYLGYFTRAEIIPRLAALRAATRALASEPGATARAAAGWTGSLTAQLARLEAAGAPEPETPEAMGQAGIARLLEALIPKVRDDALHAALREIQRAVAASFDQNQGRGTIAPLP